MKFTNELFDEMVASNLAEMEDIYDHVERLDKSLNGNRH